MRSYVPAYEVARPRSLAEALRRLAAEPGVWTPLAGGTDLMVLFEAGTLVARRMLSLWGLPELAGIRVAAGHVDLGALVTYAEIQRHAVLSLEFPSLCRAGNDTGGLAIQNRGTIGGNIANASPAADSPPALLAYDAQVHLVSAAGERWLPLAGLYLGYKRLALRPDELIAAVRLPRSAAPREHFYCKVGTRRAQAISKVVMAGVLTRDAGRLGAVRLAVGSVAPVPLRLPRTEAALAGQPLTAALVELAAQTLVAEIQPIDDIRSTAAYRAAVAANLLRRCLAGGS